MDLVDRLTKAIEVAQLGTTKLPSQVLHIGGCSGFKIQTVLNELCQYNDTRYLEIGLADGKTFCSALHGNVPGAAFGVDRDVRAECRKNVNQHVTCAPILVQGDCWTIDKTQFTDINVYFFDGGHSEADQRKAVIDYLPCMASQFILLVDDWFTPVEKGTIRVDTVTHKAIADAGLRVLMSREEGKAASDKARWWNGLGMFVLEKQP